MKIGIIGDGHVGGAMKNLFKSACVYDPYKNEGTKEEINQCDVAFICVPTPMAEDGSCDASAVEEVISWCEARLMVIRSTVWVGFTKAMKDKYNKRIVFQPEYYGETVAHPFADLSTRQWLSFGGSAKDVALAVQAYQTVMTSNVEIHQVGESEAEMAKYMENSFFAAKVTFVNEIYDLCEKLGVDYEQAREIWVADPRIGKSHTFVYPDNRGYGGHCLPKDISALRKQFEDNGVDCTMIKGIMKKNDYYKK